MRRFGTQGPVHPEKHYVVSRSAELDDFIDRVKDGRYIVIFAPRQTGKTTFFRNALDEIVDNDPTYFPISLNFEVFVGSTLSSFYENLYKDIIEEVIKTFQKREHQSFDALHQFLNNNEITDHLSLQRFFGEFERILKVEYNVHRVILIIDEFDGIPQEALPGFLHSLRRIYVSDPIQKCPYSVGIVGVKSIAQLNYDRSISPFNIQDEFNLPNFTCEQVHELLQQYTEEVGQHFENDVIESIHLQTSGQPFLVNRLAQILTDEMDIPKTQTITKTHFTKAHNHLIHEQNTNIDHLTTNIRRNRRFERILMRITAYDDGLPFNLRDNQISELATFGVIKQGADGMCEVANPVYFYCIIQTFKPTINGLEENYLPEDTSDGFLDYLSKTGHIDMNALLDNFRDFIARAGFKILQVPDTPQESVGRHLLLAYLEQFVRLVGGFMHIEVQTGRGRMDLLITHNQRKYVVETKVWRGKVSYQKGKRQLASYLKLEGATEGYYVVFDHRNNPEQRSETEDIGGFKIRSYVIPVIQERPSAESFDD
jgi:hypothetical protein